MASEGVGTVTQARARVPREVRNGVGVCFGVAPVGGIALFLAVPFLFEVGSSVLVMVGGLAPVQLGVSRRRLRGLRGDGVDRERHEERCDQQSQPDTKARHQGEGYAGCPRRPSTQARRARAARPTGQRKQRVLVPYGFSPHSQDALPVARSFVDEPSKLTLMNVVQELVAPPYLTDIVDLLDLESVKQRAEAALEQVITEAELDGARVVVGSGRAAAAICS